MTNGIIDCDVHPTMETKAALLRYLPEEWHERHRMFGGATYHGQTCPRGVPGGARGDAWPPSGGPPGSSLEMVRSQLLDRWNVRYAILNPGVGPWFLNLDYAARVTAAANDWLAAEWLDQDDRLRGSLLIPYEDAAAAAKEIERWEADRRFVQAYLQVRTERLLGHRKYWPIYEAAERCGRPIGVHFGGGGGYHPSTAAGWPSYYLEEHVGMAQGFQAHVVSLVCEGVFEHFPALKVVLIEGGTAWLPTLAWRLDRAWEQFGAEVPQVKRPPSEYIREHIWLTTQPIEEPPKPEYYERLLELFPGLEDRLMFATDYPHWDFDSPELALRKVGLSRQGEEKVKVSNAADLYGLVMG